MAKISLAGLQQFVVGFEDETFHVGIDVHKRSYHIALHRCDGRALSLVSPASPQAVIELLTGLNIRVGVVAYESGPTVLPRQNALCCRVPGYCCGSK